MSTGMLVSYTIAVTRKDVEVALPFISDTGALQPESCWFGLFLTFGAFLVSLIVAVRFLQLRGDTCPSTLQHANTASFVVGLISALGMVVVANFQDKDQLAIHTTGAAALFLGGIVYGSVQAWISFRLGNSLYKWRLIVIATSSILMVVGLCMLSTALRQLPDISQIHNCTYVLSDHDDTKPWAGYWPSCLPGYPYHVVASCCEWSISFLFLVFFLLFSPEFRQLRLRIAVEPVCESKKWTSLNGVDGEGEGEGERRPLLHS